MMRQEDEKYVQVGPPLLQEPKKTVGEAIYQSLLKYRKHDLFVDAITGEKVTYGEYFNITTKLAECMKRIGLKTNDVISVSSENNLLFFQPVFAAFYLGIIVSPINHGYIEGELLHTLQLTKPKIIFCSQMVMTKYIEIRKHCPFIQRIIVFGLKDHVQGAESYEMFLEENCDKYYDGQNFKPLKLNIEDHVAAVLCSSGTTGLPKGVMTTHKNFMVRIIQTEDPRLSKTFGPGLTKMGLMPFFHGFGFTTTVAAVEKGEKFIVMAKFDETVFLKSIQDYRITNVWVAPPLILFLAKSPLVEKYDLSSVREIICGAAPLSKDLEDKVKQRLKIDGVRQGYGLTEATLAVTLTPEGVSRPGSSGLVVPGMAIKIRDPETNRTLGPYKVGEMCVKGPMVTKGYIHNPKETKAMFTDDGWLLTGDLAYYDNQGFFFIVDRLKELIKYKGFQVAPAELEALLLKHPKIKDAAVVGKPDEAAGELPMALVVKQPGAELTAEDVKKHVSVNVSQAKRLRGGVIFVDVIPKNASGKILRRQIREMISKLPSKL